MQDQDLQVQESVRAAQGHDWKAQQAMHFKVLGISKPQKCSAHQLIKSRRKHPKK